MLASAEKEERDLKYRKRAQRCLQEYKRKLRQSCPRGKCRNRPVSQRCYRLVSANMNRRIVGRGARSHPTARVRKKL